MSKTKLPTRRELRATMLDAMATTLFSDAKGLGAGYLYDCIDEMDVTSLDVYRERVEAVAQDLVDEFARRAERLRK